MMKTTLKTPFSDFQARYVALWGAIFLVASILATVLICRLLQLLFPAGSLVSPLLLLIFYGSFGSWLLHFFQQRSIALPMLMGKLPRTWRWGQMLALVALLLLFSLGSFFVWVGLRAWFFPQITLNGLEATQVGVIERSWLSNMLNFFILVLIAPVIEEVLFRGVLLQRWAVAWGIRPAILVSSLVFGCMHPGNPLGFTVFGLIMALLFIRSRSLWVPIACHMLNNAMAEILLVFSNRSTPNEEAISVLARNSFWQGMLLWAIALPLLLLFIRRTWPRAAAAIPYQINLQQDRGSLPPRPALQPHRRPDARSTPQNPKNSTKR